MKPTAEQEALWQSVATMAVYGRDAVRTMHLLETDEVPEADDRGRRRVEGFKIAWEGRVLEGGSGVGFDDVYELLGRGGKGLGNDHRGLAGVSDFGSVKTTKLDICQEEQIFQRGPQLSVNPARSRLRPIRLDQHRRDTPRSSLGVDRGHVSVFVLCVV